MNKREALEIIQNIDTSIFGPPPMPGVYFICAKSELKRTEHILYIGSSKNMEKRILSPKHPYRILYNRLEKCLVYTRCLETENFIELEKQFIKTLRPLLNRRLYGR